MPAGLSSSDAQRRLAEFGPNEIRRELVRSGKLQPAKLVTHRFALKRCHEGLRHVRERLERASAEGDSYDQ